MASTISRSLIFSFCKRSLSSAPAASKTPQAQSAGNDGETLYSTVASFGSREAAVGEPPAFIGSQRLFPAVEKASAETVVSVAGVSCRQQIGHFTGRKPRHVVEVLRGAVGG